MHEDLIRIQAIVDMTWRAATQAAMSGTPLAGVTWIPPQTTASDWRGCLALTIAPLQTATRGITT